MITTLFTEIAALLPSLHGWCEVPKAQLLAASVVNAGSQLSIVIGAWGGRDTFALAMAHRAICKGVVIAIDPWSAGESAKDQTGENLRWWSEQKKHDDVYAQFMSTRERLGLIDYVEVHRMTSDHVPLPQFIDGPLIIDGNHGPAAERDVMRFAPRVVSKSLVYLDDLDWDGSAVRVAEQKLLSLGFEQLYKIETGAVYRKT